MNPTLKLWLSRGLKLGGTLLALYSVYGAGVGMSKEVHLLHWLLTGTCGAIGAVACIAGEWLTPASGKPSRTMTIDGEQSRDHEDLHRLRGRLIAGKVEGADAKCKELSDLVYVLHLPGDAK